jgi:hypothetical protein
MIELRLYTSSDEKEWNNFVELSRNAVFFHHRNYLSYHAHRFEEKSLMITKKGNSLAILPATAHGENIVSHGGLSFAGLLMSRDLKMMEVMEIFEQLKQYYKSAGYKKLLYKAIPSVFHRYPSEEDLYALFRSNAVLVRRDISSCIYVPERIRFSETKRQFIRKCATSGVMVSEQENYSDYWKLLTEVIAFHGTLPTHTLEDIILLHQRFPSQIRLFEARDRNQLLAGAVIFDFGQVAHTQYMANSPEGRKRGALDFLIHTLIEKFFGNHKFFNFGISTEASGKHLNVGLIQQKELIGGRGIVYDFYELTL